ncbi:MAG: hypothetical protein AAFW00_07795 [Bacteroidota bacterium]
MNLSEENTHDYIDAYIAQELNPEEQSAFEQEMAANPALAERVAFYRRVFQQARRKEREERGKRILAEIFEEEEEKDIVPQPIIRKWMPQLLAAASVVLICVIGYFLLRPRASFEYSPTPWAQLVEEEQKSTATAGSMEDVKSQRERIIALFQQDASEEVLRLSGPFLDSLPDDIQIRRIRGLLHAQKGAFVAARNDWNHIWLNENGYLQRQKCEAGTLVLWSLIEEKNQEEIEKFFQRWDQLEGCPNLPENTRETALYVRSNLSDVISTTSGKKEDD